MPEAARLTGTSFVLAVPDAEVSADWWVSVVGFRRVFSTQGWVFVQRDACVVRLGSCPDALPPADLGDHSYFAYVEVDSIDSLFAEISSNRGDVLFTPVDRPWGMREMAVRTCDGHRLMFAENRIGKHHG